ncbi:MAG: dihydrodipicolinate synthase family protein [Bryobacteraceae bacterium]
MSPQQLRDKLRGPVVAMTTHFKDDYSLDLDAMRRLTEYYVNEKVPTVIVTGSTGEFFSLTDEERKQAIATVVKAAAGKMTVVAGCAHSGTQLTIDMVRYAEECGADGAMVTPPYYTYSGFEGLRRHYDLITQATQIGIVIYFSGSVLNGVTNLGIIGKPEMMLDLVASCNGHGSGFKDASGNFHFYRDVTLLLKDQLSVMGSNGMNYYLYGQRFGSACCLTGLGNIWPKWEIEFCRLLDAGDITAAEKIVKEKDLPYLRICKTTGRYWACVKALQEMVGLPGGPMRSPLLDCTPAQRDELRRVCEEIGIFEHAGALSAR